MNSKLIIEGSRQVTIESIKQWHTYRGLFAGIPNERLNEKIIKRTKRAARAFCHMDEIYLIEPKQKPIDYDGKHSLESNPASLPEVTCMAVLWSNSLRDPEKDYSSLCIIWFQEDYAFPIEKDILSKIKEIPYRKICGEFNV